MDAELIEGLKKLKTGAKVNLISIVLVLISLVIIFGSIGSIGMVNPENPQAFLVVMSTIGSFMALIVIAVILGIIGFVMYFMATGNLRRYDSKLSIGRWGMLLQVIGLILMFVPVVVMAFIALATGSRADGTFLVGALLSLFGLLFVGAILIIVGAVLFGIMLMRLGEDPNVESGFKTAGIIYLIGIILSFVAGGVGEILGIVTTILIYINAKNSLKKLAT